MATIVKVEYEGFAETQELFKQIVNDFGYKDASNIMRNAVRQSMQPVLAKAKSMVAKDTGALAASLQIETRKPGKKDFRSKYILPGDIVIGTVTTASGNKLAKTKFKNVKTGEKQTGIESDARAIAVEFGTAKMGAKPFMRPALESSSAQAASTIGEALASALIKYKAKQAKKVKI